MIDPIFNMYKTKFTVLDQLHLLDPTKNKVRVFINLEMVLKTLLSARNNNQLYAEGDPNDAKLSIISNIVNLGQHYRLYFAKYRKKSEIYIYCNYPHDRFKNSDFIIGYRSYYVNKVLKNDNCLYIIKALEDAFQFLKVLGKYVDGVYLITENSVESSVIPYIIKENSSDETDHVQDIIVSNTKYDLQYVNHGFSVLYPMGDDSTVINQTNVVDKLKDICRVKTDINIPPSFIPFIISMIGDRYKSIPKMAGVGLSTVLKTIDMGITKKLITTSTTNIEMLSNIIREQHREAFVNNYKCVDINLQYNRLSKSDIHRILSNIEDKFDDNALRTINERYFQMHPLMLINPRSEQILNGEYTDKSIFT